MTDDEPLTIPPEVYRQIEATRESGAVNMLTEIHSGLRQLEFHEALEWVNENYETYIEHAMRGGFEPAEDDSLSDDVDYLVPLGDDDE
mgnify:CR=1 FL=1